MAQSNPEVAFERIEDGLKKDQKPKKEDLQHMYSLHGSKAAYRRAITELLFFASVGGETRTEFGKQIPYEENF